MAKKEMPMAATPMNDTGDDETPPDHQIEHWANTLMDAESIKKDESKMKHVRPHLEKKAKAIRSIADLRKRARDAGA